MAREPAIGERVEVGLTRMVDGQTHNMLTHVVRVEGLRVGARISLEGHKSYPALWTVSAMGPMRLPQHKAFNIARLQPVPTKG